MKLKPQGRLEGTLLGRFLKTRPAVIASNWVFQGMRYMNKYEITLKMIIDLILATILFIYLNDVVVDELAIVLSLVIAHSINWVLNGHIFVLMRYVAPIPKTEQQFESFIQRMKTIALDWQSIDGIAIYGSYCRGALHKYSDLDVRVLTRPGFINSVYGAIFCFYLRLLAFFDVFPLDIYACDNMQFLDQLRDDEKPAILIDHSGRLAQRYASVKNA